MEFHGSITPQSVEDGLERGPWTVEEDLLLMNYIAAHGEVDGTLLLVAQDSEELGRAAGSGGSTISDLTSAEATSLRRAAAPHPGTPLSLGNRWSKIAQFLPGRTDNEIKNYWRTRVQKHAKQLKCDVNSKQFKDVMRYLWMPRLIERIRVASGDPTAVAPAAHWTPELAPVNPSPDNSSTAGSSSLQFSPQPVPDSCADCSTRQGDGNGGDVIQPGEFAASWSTSALSPGGDAHLGLLDFDQIQWGDSLWTVEDIWLQQQF
ncbi:unnamed protein product [Musa acuminata subsp. burmannicoides]